mmetsp:Transcript_1249/g.2980  ORF Transcript_1249/g.2980 Transcript_1249/m.2980 type:complete len:205 (+) Transcript_1249:4634-5248(+)
MLALEKLKLSRLTSGALGASSWKSWKYSSSSMGAGSEPGSGLQSRCSSSISEGRGGTSSPSHACCHSGGECHSHVSMVPLPFMATAPLCTSFRSRLGNRLFVALLIWMVVGTAVCSSLAAVFTVSPNTDHFGTSRPTRPLTHGPVCRPMRSLTGWSSGMRTSRAARIMSTARLIMRPAPSAALWNSSTAQKPSSSGARIPLATK